MLEIGIAEYDEDSGRISPVYSEMIRYPDIREFDSGYVNDDGSRGIWIYRNSDMRIEDTLDAEKDLETVIGEVRGIVTGKEVTSYNVPFDFFRFLLPEPWSLQCKIPIDIMDQATDRVYELAESDSIEDKEL